MMKRRLLGIIVGVLSVLVEGAGKTAPKNGPAATEVAGRFRISILPRSLQANPYVDFNVITEVTKEGHKVRRPTSERPVYYVLQAGPYQKLGESPPGDVKVPPVNLLELAMKEALNKKGYREAEPPKHPPTLVVLFTYGDHSATNAETDVSSENATARMNYEQSMQERAELIAGLQQKHEADGGMGEDDLANLPPPPPQPENLSTPGSVEELLPYVLADRRKHVEVIERASLIGGVEFGRELAGVLKEEVAARRVSKSTNRAADTLATEIARQNVINTAGGGREPPSGMMITGGYLGLSSPFQRYYRRDETTARLVTDAFSSCYFVIASAYDGASIAKGEKRLLWRTKMTVNSSGVSMADTLPGLIRSAAPHFGEKMDKVVTVTKRAVRGGDVQFGPATVVEGGANESSTPARDGAESRK